MSGYYRESYAHTRSGPHKDSAPLMVSDEAPWPLVGECFASHRPDHACQQCDGSHEHRWVTWHRAPVVRESFDPVSGERQRVTTVIAKQSGPGLPTRCTVCGGRKCDWSDCLLRRHHGGPHELF